MPSTTNQRRRQQMVAIQEAVAEAFGLTVLDLTHGSIIGGVGIARQVAMYLMSQLTDASVLEIGRAFERHHTTVVHAIAKTEEGRRTSPELEAMVNKLFYIIASK